MFEFTQEQLAIQELVRDIAQGPIKANAERIDKTGAFPKENIDLLTEAGITQLTIPEEFGGTGMDDEIAKAIAVAEIARTCASTAEIIDVHYLGTDILMRRGTEEQKAKYLPEAAAGKLAGFALTEPGAGTDASGQKTRAVKDGSDYIINGAKCFISNLGPEEGNHFICVAVTEPGIGAKGTTAFLVDRSMPGLSCGKVEDKMGIRGASVSELILEDVRVPETAIIGGIGNGVRTALEGLDGGRIGIASQACGVAYGALDEAIKYSGERIQFGKPINANQGIQWYLAEMKAQADMAWLLTLRAAALRQAGKPCTVEAALAKWKAAEAAGTCVDLALQIHGGYGYMKDYPIERMYRDARILRIYEGTSEAQKMVISRALLKK
ncbi:MAG: acyl-CoA dehydrogenase family protein [Lachnospiraceae bacterium]|nr:acyl-CoA dehydrogenase family protein [Lachnospiraceae bacterium]